MGENTNREDLDWDSLSNPVPIDLVDAGFETRAVPLVLPGSRSEMLPRAESEALTNAPDAPPVPDATEQMPGHGPSADPQAPNSPTLQMPAHSSPFYATGRTGGGGTGGSGGTTFGVDWPQEEAAIQDEFSRIRANMEAEAEAEKLAKAEADKEEAGQRQRLEQWMENARKRLLKADEDLTPPSARIRIRKDHSPSLYRLAEMQKTIWVEGQSTHAEAPNAAAGQAAPPAPPLDPMATISVPTEQFLTLDAPAQPTMREQALARQAQQQAAQLAAIQQAAKQPSKQASAPQSAKQAAAAPKVEAQNALTMHTAPANAHAAETPGTQKGGETAFQPMTREQALTRKVAQLRKVAEGAENTLAIGPAEHTPERSALQYAIAAVVVVAICVLGIALFAATQAGLFDGLENRIPFLKPKVSAAPRPVPAPPAAPAAARPAAPAATVLPADVAPGNQPPPRGNPAATQPPSSAASSIPAPTPAPAAAVPVAAAPDPASATRSAPATVRPWAPAHAPAAKPAKSVAGTAAKAPAKPAARPETARRPAAKKSVSPAAFAAQPVSDELPAAPASAKAAVAASEADDGEIPAYAKPRAKAANLGEIILRASVQAATNIDKDNLLEMYNRYALGFPGLSGEVVIGLTVDPSGRVLEGSVVSSSTGVEAFDQELLRKVLDWRLRAFPESRPKFITVPFLFPLQGR